MQFTEDTLNKEVKFTHDDGTEGLIIYRNIGTFTPVANSYTLGQIVATMMFRCIELGDIERIKSLLKIPEFNINKVYYVKPRHEGNAIMKRTALMYAIESMQLDVIRFLMEKGANMYINHLGYTALRLASIMCSSNNNNPICKEIYDYFKSLDDAVKTPKIEIYKSVETNSKSNAKVILFWSAILIAAVSYIYKTLKN